MALHHYSVAIDHLTLARLPAPELVTVAAETGYCGVSLFLRPRFFRGADALPGLLDHAGLRRETRRRLAAEGIAVTCIEGLRIHEALDDEEIVRGLDVTAELGAPAVNTLVYDVDAARALERLARLCELGAERNIAVLLEFNPLTEVRRLSDAAALAARPDMPGLRVQLDTLHHARGGGTVAEVRACVAERPELIAHVQVSDGPATVADDAAYLREAVRDRAIPGQGVLPLAELLATVPAHALISAEVPQGRSEAEGATPHERAQAAAAGLRTVLTEAERIGAER